MFRAVRRDGDYWGYHGQEFPFIGWNELTKYPNDNLFEAMMSCNRSSFRPEDFPQYDENDVEYFLPEIPLEIFATCNPFGVGHNWVKKRFIDKAPLGRMFRTAVNVFNPRTQRREEVVKTQVHMFGSYRENKYLSPEYIAELEQIKDPNKRKAWLGGHWDVLAGGMFDDVWDTRYHVLRPFQIPFNWRIDRAFDYGSSKPFSVGWWAESDGSPYQDHEGAWIPTVKGDLFRIAEWYGWTGKTNQGLRMLANEIASGIIERELAMGIHSRVKPGPADNAIWNVDNGNSIAVDMAKPVKLNGKTYPGIEFIRSDKSPGSRIAGWERMRRFFDASKAKKITNPDGTVEIVPRDHPGLFVFSNCKCFIDQILNLLRDEDNPDDVDSDAEDHIADEARYKTMSVNMGARGGRTKGT